MHSYTSGTNEHSLVGFTHVNTQQHTRARKSTRQHTQTYQHKHICTPKHVCTHKHICMPSLPTKLQAQIGSTELNAEDWSMYVELQTHVSTHRHAPTHVCTQRHTRTRKSAQTGTYTCAHKRTYVCTQAHISTCLCAHTRVCTRRLLRGGRGCELAHLGASGHRTPGAG